MSNVEKIFIVYLDNRAFPEIFQLLSSSLLGMDLKHLEHDLTTRDIHVSQLPLDG